MGDEFLLVATVSRVIVNIIINTYLLLSNYLDRWLALMDASCFTVHSGPY